MSSLKYQSHDQKYTAENPTPNDLSNQGYYLVLKQKLSCHRYTQHLELIHLAIKLVN
jgi:hypothetical protein